MLALVALAVAAVAPDLGLAKDRPDLVLTKLADPPSSVLAGSPLAVGSTVKNKGKAKAKASAVAFHLTRDAVLDAGDVEIGTVATPALKPKKSSTASASLTVPSLIPAGNYSVIACADAKKAVKEQKERNNCSASALAVTVIDPIDVTPPPPDTTPPAAPAVTGSAPPSPGSDQTPNLTGTAEAGSTVRIFSTADCSGTERGSGSAADFAGAGVTSTSIPGNAVTGFRATATDAAGNVSACSGSAFNYTHDDVSPVVPTTLATSPASPSSDGNPDVTGNTEPNATVRVFTNGTCAGSPAATGAANGAGAFSVDTPVTANASNTLAARALDAAGNASACSGAINYVEDSVAPAPPAITSTSPVSPSNADTTPDVNGTAENSIPAVSVRLYKTNCTGVPVATGTAPAGVFSFPGVSVAANTTTGFQADAVDQAGNVSGCSGAFSYTHDSIAPGAPVLNAFSPATSTDNTPLAKGSEGDGTATIRLYHSSTCSGPQVGSGGVALFQGAGIAPTTLQRNGFGQAFSADALDPAGNPSLCSGSQTHTESRATAAQAETEPNDFFLSPDPSVLTEDHLISGVLGFSAGGDPPDIFNVTPPSTAIMRFEVFDSTGADCGAAVGTPNATWKDPLAGNVTVSNDGIGSCPAITKIVNPGNGQHAISIHDGNNGAAYQLEARTLRDVGAEDEAGDNDLPGSADPFPAGNDIYMTGTAVTGDGGGGDFFSFTVGTNTDVRLELVDQIGGTSADNCSNSSLQVSLNNGVTNLVNGSSTSYSNCQLIDGTGATPAHPAAANLAAGTYMAQVFQLGGVNQDYSIALTTRP